MTRIIICTRILLYLTHTDRTDRTDFCSRHCAYLSKTLAYCQSVLFHDFRLCSECKSPEQFLLASFNLAFNSFALRSAALHFLISSFNEDSNVSMRESASSNLDKRSLYSFYLSRKSCKTRSIARFFKSAAFRRSTR